MDFTQKSGRNQRKKDNGYFFDGWFMMNLRKIAIQNEM